MLHFGDVLDNVIIGRREGSELYNRIFVVSAYGGITDLLLEKKKTGEPGVYAKFAEGDPSWDDSLELVRQEMLKINREFRGLGLDLEKANAFVEERVSGIKSCLKDLIKLRSFGHLQPDDYLPATRELLSAVGEAHSAYNSTLILQERGVNAMFMDLTGWREEGTLPLKEMIRESFEGIDFSSRLCIATGYTKCSEGIMTRFNRGYSEITFSMIAVVTGAGEGVIHKEFHLSTGDPKVIGIEKVRKIGRTNFDIADQLSDMGMEAIHPSASKEMELEGICIRVKNTFDPEDPGTLIGCDYVNPESKVDMICAREDILAVEVFDSEMVGESGYDYRLLKHLYECRISYIAKNTNANTITHYVSETDKSVPECIRRIRKEFPGAKIKTRKVALVSAMGSNMKIPGFMSKAAEALAGAGINILAVDQCMRQVNMQFIVERRKCKEAQAALHKGLVEDI